jgi:hypothetical protein
MNPIPDTGTAGAQPLRGVAPFGNRFGIIENPHFDSKQVR